MDCIVTKELSEKIADIGIFLSQGKLNEAHDLAITESRTTISHISNLLPRKYQSLFDTLMFG